MMRKRCFVAALSLIALAATAQTATDTSRFYKTGMSFGILPAVAYDSDLGFQYGVISNLYWYGDGSRYPIYNHSLYLEVSRYVAGTMLCRAYYDSNKALEWLSDGLRLTVDVTWFRDLLMDFSGFNGRKSVYRDEWIDEDAAAYRTRIFYNHHRSMLRGMVGVRYDFEDTPLYWQAGVSAFNMDIGSVHRSELRHDAPEEPSLYDLYCRWGVIREKESRGGTDVFLRGGIGIDTRDSEAFPSRGIWSELQIAAAPGFMDEHTDGFLRLTLVHRHYLRLWSPKAVFAYRLTFQNRLCGRVPFYILPHLTTSTLTSATSQGLGGSKTMRGMVRNRVVADGVAMGNVEFRWLFANFRLFSADWNIGTNIFSDFGITTQEYDLDMSGVPAADRALLFRDGRDKLHATYGIGLKIHMNTNFVVSADYGRTTSADDGTSGTYVMLNYLF